MEHVRTPNPLPKNERYKHGRCNVSSVIRNRNTADFKRRALEIEQERIKAVNKLVALLK